MKGMNKQGSTQNPEDYPYVQEILLFASLGSIVGGVLVECGVLFAVGSADLVRVSYQPLIYAVFTGFIPALLTGITLAYKPLWRDDKRRIWTSFFTGFVISALYSAVIILFLGIFSRYRS